jgi:hypothetical protein
VFKPTENLTYELRRESLFQYRRFYLQVKNDLAVLDKYGKISYQAPAPVNNQPTVTRSATELPTVTRSAEQQQQQFYWLLDFIADAAYVTVRKMSLTPPIQDGEKFSWDYKTDFSGTLRDGFKEPRVKCLDIANRIFFQEKVKIEKLITDKAEKNEAVSRADLIELLSAEIAKEISQGSIHSSSLVVQRAMMSTPSTALENHSAHGMAWFVWPLVCQYFDTADVESTRDQIANHRINILHAIGEALQDPDTSIPSIEHESQKDGAGNPVISFQRLVDRIYEMEFTAETFTNGGQFVPYPAEIMTVLSHLMDSMGLSDRRTFVVDYSKEYRRIKTRVSKKGEARTIALNQLFFP